MNNYMRYRGLFAVEMALLPLIVAFKLIIGTWAVCIPLLMIAVCRCIMIFVKNKAKKSDHMVESIGDAIIIAFLAIYFAILGFIPTWLSVVVCILVPLYELANVYFYAKPMSEVVEALDFCYLAFVFTTIISLSFVMVKNLDVVAKVSFIAIMLTMAIVIAYKLYRFINYYLINRKSKFQKERAKVEKAKNK
ncbi:MAG: hypothetical protein IJ371_05135 [Clostridia bacterium]|nr:hypothetical protein [Clostridia bacterium]